MRHESGHHGCGGRSGTGANFSGTTSAHTGLARIGAGVLAALALIGCGGGGTAPSHPNLLLITVDTLRADHLQAYGFERMTSPRLAELADESVVFEEAQSSSSWTLPAIATLMTSELPSAHGCVTFQSALPESFRTLAEVLTAASFDTSAIVSHFFLDRRFGLSQGFTQFDADLVNELELSHVAITSDAVTAKARRFIELKAHSTDEQPWFLWCHYFDPHAHYQPHDGYNFGSEPSDLYDGEIAFTDAAIGRLLATLEASGLAKDTVVVFVADHGEQLGEHGEFGHGNSLHREAVHIPLFVRAPDLEPRAVACPVGLVDLMPTVLDLLGVDAGFQLGGQSLLPLMRGAEHVDVPVLSELDRLPGQSLASITVDHWRLVRDETAESAALFDVSDDPLEDSDVSLREPDRTRELGEVLDRLRSEARSRGEAHSAVGSSLGHAELEALRSLGYLERTKDARHD